MPSNLFGYHQDLQETERIMKGLPTPYFSHHASESLQDTPIVSKWLWRFEEYLFGWTLNAFNQTIGDCVSQGYGRAVQDLFFRTIVKRVMNGETPMEAHLISTEAIYGFSRVEVGNRRLGRGDGSIGAWAADAVTRYGVLPRKKFKEGYDLTNYDGNRAKDWGWSGVPDDIEDDARLSLIKSASLVTSFEEAARCLSNDMPIPVCSSQGFKQTRRSDGTGICDPQGTWAHCMVFRGVMILKGNRPVLCCQQSWGDDPKGSDTVYLEDGREVKLPMGVFNVDAEIADRMLRKNSDSFVLNTDNGFDVDPNQKDLDFFMSKE